MKTLRLLTSPSRGERNIWTVYLLKLRNAPQEQNISGTSAPVKIGDVVLVCDQGYPEGFLKFAQVEKLITGRDGLVCRAGLWLPSRNGQQTTQSEYHPVNESTATPQETPLESDRSEDQVEPLMRPQRASATRARHWFKEWSREMFEGATDYKQGWPLP